jgi:GcrA cell cycle regulator
MEWTEEAVAKLRELWPIKSRHEVARELGTTPGAVSGKANQLKLQSGRKRGHAPGAGPSRERAIAAPPALAPAPARVSLGLNDLAPPGSCQWPFGEPGRADFRFCGCPATRGRPYCEEHVKLAYEPAQARVKADPYRSKQSPLTVRWAA